MTGERKSVIVLVIHDNPQDTESSTFDQLFFKSNLHKIVKILFVRSGQKYERSEHKDLTLKMFDNIWRAIQGLQKKLSDL